MDSQRPFLYLALFFTGFLIWQAWVADHAPPPSPTAARQPTAPAPTRSTGADIPAAAEAPQSPEAEASVSSANTSQGSTVHVVTDVLDVAISTRGGDITAVRLPTYPVSVDKPDTPLTLLSADKPYIAQSGLLHDKTVDEAARRAPNHYALYEAEQHSYTLDGKERLEVSLHWQGQDGIQVDKVFTFHKGEFYIDVDYRIRNASGSDWVGREYTQLRHGTLTVKSGMFGGSNSRSYQGAAYYNGKFEKLPFKKMAENPLKETVTGGWVSMLQHYFLSAWIPASTEAENLLYSKVVKGVRGE